MDIENRAQVFKALGHPVRLRIVIGLAANEDNECNVNKMTQKLGLPQSTVSQHLGILKSAGIIKPYKKGVSTCYKVIDEYVKDII